VTRECSRQRGRINQREYQLVTSVNTVGSKKPTDMVNTKEETFGPVAPLYRFKTEADAVKMANDTPTLPSPARGRPRGRVREGVASYFYSRDIGRIWRVAEALEYGIVGINEGIISPKARWRDRALRRHEGKRHRPRRLSLRHRGVPRSQIPLHGRRRPLAGSAVRRRW
jgi:Aldehyde dehydrogenase family